MSSLTPEFFNTLIVVVIILGVALALVRLYADFTRPLPEERLKRIEPIGNDDDTRPNPPVKPEDIS